jgi:hypothetical protein
LAYFLHINDPDQVYLDNLPISAPAKERLEDFIEYGIKNVNDAFRKNPMNRPQLNGPFFKTDFLLLDEDGDGHYHHVLFVIDDQNANFGVLVLVYVDHRDCGP